MQEDNANRDRLLELTAQIAAAWAGANRAPASELPALIASIHAALLSLRDGAQDKTASGGLQPAVDPQASVQDEFLICLEDGKKFKSLKRHLRTRYNMTPQAYREKWGLPADYPMVAPGYAKARSHLAHKMKLGQKRD